LCTGAQPNSTNKYQNTDEKHKIHMHPSAQSTAVIYTPNILFYFIFSLVMAFEIYFWLLISINIC
jgi:hypothetical protein